MNFYRALCIYIHIYICILISGTFSLRWCISPVKNHKIFWNIYACQCISPSGVKNEILSSEFRKQNRVIDDSLAAFSRTALS